eukprot:NODE_7676_length_443_cov_2728.923858_g6832_i0.p1 GENE.NODE_7676_length_443_cov_2728.923858_g6832_i0~~NODE_7676_length_443_cov_2728.923858_g6832_i0.p1  ORF type:complete len:72 (+),score=24.39 NODE_7676_length_443_cov_2728.923858_g6832_i0:105-320(+)
MDFTHEEEADLCIHKIAGLLGEGVVTHAGERLGGKIIDKMKNKREARKAGLKCFPNGTCCDKEGNCRKLPN